MSSNPLSNLLLDYWYKAVLVIGTCTLIVSLTVETKGVENSVVQLISLGVIFIGIGEWINHPLQTRIYPRAKITGHPRINKIGGNLFDIFGLASIIFGVIGIVT